MHSSSSLFYRVIVSVKVGEFVRVSCALLCHSMLSVLDYVAVSLKVGEFVGAAMAILEGIAQHPTLLMEHQTLVIETVLPELVSMVGSQTGKMSMYHGYVT